MFTMQYVSKVLLNELSPQATSFIRPHVYTEVLQEGNYCISLYSCTIFLYKTCMNIYKINSNALLIGEDQIFED